MKKHYLIYLFFLCLIVSGCEKGIFDEENEATQTMTRSSIALSEAALYNTCFQNIQTTKASSGYGISIMTADISTYAEGVEYDFTLWCTIRGDIKCYVSAISGEIIYNGKNYYDILGESGKQIKFTVKFHSSKTQIRLAFENAQATTTYYHDASAKLVISSAKYHGAPIIISEVSRPGESRDLYIEAKYPANPLLSTVGMWKCNICGTINYVLYDWNCKNQGFH